MAKKWKPPLTRMELACIELDWPDGLTTSQILELFEQRGFRLTEATIRKYVERGLLPQSRRVGRAGGSHTGSVGLYPACTVRLIVEIRKLMHDGFPIAQIADELRNAVALSKLDATAARFFSRLASEVEALSRAHGEGDIARELRAARHAWRRFRAQATRIERRLKRSPDRTTPTSQATG